MKGGVVEACKTVLIVSCLNRVSARVRCKHAVLSATCVCTLSLSAMSALYSPWHGDFMERTQPQSGAAQAT